ncbi:MAG: SRPBCC family protein, partial [Promethearchaeota archaeon]
ASPERIWKILTEIENYPDWNPYIRHANGQIEQGHKLKLYIEPPGSDGMTFKPTVKKVVPNTELRWFGRLLIPKIFDGEHIFQLESQGNGKTRFIQREIFNGLLVRLYANRLDRDIKKGFEEMNQALKRRVEQLN